MCFGKTSPQKLHLTLLIIEEQAEAEVVPSSSLVEIEVEVGDEVQLKRSYIKLG